MVRGLGTRMVEFRIDGSLASVVASVMASGMTCAVNGGVFILAYVGLRGGEAADGCGGVRQAASSWMDKHAWARSADASHGSSEWFGGRSFERRSACTGMHRQAGERSWYAGGVHAKSWRDVAAAI